MAAHKRNDADLVEFVESLSPHRRAARRATRRPGAAPPPRRWTVPLIAIVAALFAMGGGIALAATPSDEPPPESSCTLTVPADPLTAQGLATAYRLQAPCHEADPDTSAFVQATVVDPATGAISVYNPVVTDQDSEPAAPPVVPQLPTGAIVGIWFGFNGDNLTLADSGGSLRAGSCVNGLDDSIFGQYAYCNAPAFFTAANAAIAAGKITVPGLGTAKDGRACPSTRDFGLVDMDQSDNVTSTYLFLPDGSTAQNTAANQAKLAAQGAKVEVNASDNGLLDNFVSPSLGCTPYSAPDLAEPGHMATALALNELQAAAHQAAPIALIPTSDPMALVDGKTSVAKTNLYRAGVDQGTIDTAVETPKAYCRNLVDVGVSRAQLDRPLTLPVNSPDAGAANSLFTFLAQRLAESFTELDCGRLLGTANPVKVVTNDDGVVTDARLTPPAASASPSPTTPASRPASASAPASAPASTPASASAGPSSSARPSASAPARPSATPSSVASRPAPPATTPPARPAPTTAAPARTQAAPPPAPTQAAAPPGGTQQGAPATGHAAPPPANNPAVVPAGNPGGTPAGGAGTAPVAPSSADSPGPAPTLTLGPMPVRAGTHGGSSGGGVGSIPPARLAGTVLLSAGGVLTIGILLRSLVNARRRRHRFAEL